MCQKILIPKDHPRSRGEYLAAWKEANKTLGSSPLSRGIHLMPLKWTFLIGIIPALAGNTMDTCTVARVPRDHPRSRGEYQAALAAKTRQLGSSPLSRGIRGLALCALCDPRIIPALAGNTWSAPTPQPPSPDHPRSRGEYAPRVRVSCVPPGSSPLSRGIPRRIRRQLRQFRIIPALAGNTRTALRAWGCTGDHPRSRGEYTGRTADTGLREGSSPLSRGILRPPESQRLGARIIPALAGNTWSKTLSPPSYIGSSPLSRGIPPIYRYGT